MLRFLVGPRSFRFRGQGSRVGSLLTPATTVDHIQWADNILVLGHMKNTDGHEIVLTDRAVSALRRLVEALQRSPVWHGRTTPLFLGPNGRVMTLQWLNRAPKRAAATAGVRKHVTTHVFRHSPGTPIGLENPKLAMQQRGVTEEVFQRHYNKPSPQDRPTRRDVLPGLQTGQRRPQTRKNSRPSDAPCAAEAATDAAHSPPMVCNRRLWLVAPTGFEPVSQVPKTRMIDHYTRGLWGHGAMRHSVADPTLLFGPSVPLRPLGLCTTGLRVEFPRLRQVNPMPTQASSQETPAIHAHRTAKVVELVASSTKSFEDAIKHAIQDASKTTRGITGCHVESQSVKCKDGQILEYRVALKLAFGVESSPHV